MPLRWSRPDERRAPDCGCCAQCGVVGREMPSSPRRSRRRRRPRRRPRPQCRRSEEHTSELQSLMRISYAVFCLKKKKKKTRHSKKTSAETKTHRRQDKRHTIPHDQEKTTQYESQEHQLTSNK